MWNERQHLSAICNTLKNTGIPSQIRPNWYFYSTVKSFVSMQPEQRTCMFDTVLHIGLEHPSVLWILLPSLLSFLTGLGFGLYSNRLQAWLRPQHTEVTN